MDPRPDLARRPLARIRAAAGSVAIALLAIGWMATLRPTSLGGPAGYVVVSGTSMEPTFSNGDLVITERRGSYARGDVVAFRAAGGLVIHRVVAVEARGLVTRGDNRTEADVWRTPPQGVLGRAWLRVPAVGALVAVAGRPPIPPILAGLAVFVAVIRRRPPSR